MGAIAKTLFGVHAWALISKTPFGVHAEISKKVCKPSNTHEFLLKSLVGHRNVPKCFSKADSSKKNTSLILHLAEPRQKCISGNGSSRHDYSGIAKMGAVAIIIAESL